MAVRILKTVLVGWISLLCLLYAAQNVANLEQAHGAIAYVLSLEGHEVYPASFLPAVTQPALVWFVTIFIITLEFAAGGLAAKGTWDLWRARRSAEAFNRSKTWAILGAGMAVFVWLGLFSVIGGAAFQMWQTQLGAGSLEGAFQYLSMSAFVLLFVNMKDD